MTWVQVALLRTALVVCELQFMCVLGLIVFPIICPAVPDPDIVLVLVVFDVHQDSQGLPYLDDLTDGSRLK